VRADGYHPYMAFKEFQEFGGGGGRGFLDGQMLIAMPTMNDPRFERSVVYMCAHSDDGAMGIIVNQLAQNINFTELLRQLEIIGAGEEIRLPPEVGQMRVHIGGPVETGRGFVLHSSDWFVDSSTLPIDDTICLTATLDILKAIAKGDGPENSLLALGYAGWAPGQLETEIQANGWLHCNADPDLVFGEDQSSKYDQALKKLGIDPGHLASDSGHA
jgi:putative transcriptional regulator